MPGPRSTSAAIEGETHIRCAECGRLYKQLSGHLRVHGMNTAEYRAIHGLPTSTPLVSAQVRRAKARAARAQYPTNHGLRDAPRTARWRRRHLAGVRAAWAQNSQRPTFQQLWREAVTRAAATRARNLRRRYSRQAAELGYRDLRQLLARTWHLTDLEFGQLLGMSESNAGYLRARRGRRPARELAGAKRRTLQYVRAINRRYDHRAQAAGYPGITELLDQTRDLLTRQLAQLLCISPQAAGRLRTDPSMARLRPGRGEPIEPTAQLVQRRGERHKGSIRPTAGDGQRNWWRARHEALAIKLGHADLETMVQATLDLPSKEFGALLNVSEDTASQLRRGFYPAGDRRSVRRQATRDVTQMRYDARARSLGYPDMDSLLAQTQTMTLRQLQDLLGISMGTAHRLRHAWTQGSPPS